MTIFVKGGQYLTKWAMMILITTVIRTYTVENCDFWPHLYFSLIITFIFMADLISTHLPRIDTSFASRNLKSNLTQHQRAGSTLESARSDNNELNKTPRLDPEKKNPFMTVKEGHRRNKTLDVSITDMVNEYAGNKKLVGIEGYNIARFNAFLD